MPALPVPERAYAPPGPATVKVLHIDEHLLVADKPTGLLSVPGRGVARQASVLTYLSAVHGPLQAVHRLDMDTSGLLAFARTAETASRLGTAFEAREVSKTYHALVEGCPQGRHGRIDLAIGRDWAERPKRRIDPQGGKPACTLWRLEETRGGIALLRLEPLTGRTHQIRLHLAAIGHPVRGDRLYGRSEGETRLALHASELWLPHPQTGAVTGFSSPHPFACH